MIYIYIFFHKYHIICIFITKFYLAYLHQIIILKFSLFQSKSLYNKIPLTTTTIKKEERKRKKSLSTHTPNPNPNTRSIPNSTIPSRSKVINRGYLSKNHPISLFLPSLPPSLSLSLSVYRKITANPRSRSPERLIYFVPGREPARSRVPRRRKISIRVSSQYQPSIPHRSASMATDIPAGSFPSPGPIPVTFRNGCIPERASGTERRRQTDR